MLRNNGRVASPVKSPDSPEIVFLQGVGLPGQSPVQKVHQPGRPDRRRYRRCPAAHRTRSASKKAPVPLNHHQILQMQIAMAPAHVSFAGTLRQK